MCSFLRISQDSLSAVLHKRAVRLMALNGDAGRAFSFSALSSNTAPFRPWKLHWYCAFGGRAKAETFERYLKSASGRAFQVKHF